MADGSYGSSRYSFAENDEDAVHEGDDPALDAMMTVNESLDAWKMAKAAADLAAAAAIQRYSYRTVHEGDDPALDAMMTAGKKDTRTIICVTCGVGTLSNPLHEHDFSAGDPI
jgi:hypothetical protein